MATYQEALKAKKNATERYRYYRRKHDIGDTYSSQQSVIPILEKGETSEYYDYMTAYYNSLDPEYYEEKIEEIYYEPDDDTAPFDVSFSDEYSDRLHKLSDLIGGDFDSIIEYVYDYSGLSEIDIEDLLSQCESYISTIEGIYSGYVSNRPTSSTLEERNNMYWASKRTLNKMANEVFGIDING